jgi:uridine phosphorylase
MNTDDTQDAAGAVARPSELMIRDGVAYHIGAGIGDVAPNLFLVGDPARAARVAERFDALRVERRHREYVTLTGEVRGVPVTVMGTGIGTDNVEIGLVEAWSLLAFDPNTRTPLPAPPPMRVIRIGTSGGVRADIPAGTFAISSHGLGLDSTGLYFEHPAPDATTRRVEAEAVALLRRATPSGYRFRDLLFAYLATAGTPAVSALSAAASAHGIPTVTGITAAAPGFYGASGRYLAGLRNTVPDIKGVLATLEVDGLRVVNMEMESSLLFHLAGAIGAVAGTICPVISNPARQDAVVDYAPLVERAIDVAVDAMVAMAE